MDPGPAQPSSILRGHKSQVQAACFIRCNERLVTGDADGYVVVWDLTIMRPRAVWQGHTNAVLGLEGWGNDRIITHGRDNELTVWKLGLEDEDLLSTALPLEASTTPRPKPWVLHVLPVNGMNFCSFATCPALPGTLPADSSEELLVAAPNALDMEAIDIFHLPSQSRRHTVKPLDNTGMAMALALVRTPTGLRLAAAFENGTVVVTALDNDSGTWNLVYKAQPHTQPVLSLDVSKSLDFFVTSGADAIIAKHPIPSISLGSTEEERTNLVTEPIRVVNTKHSGQQSIRARSDGRILATAGWDSKVRVYSAKTLKEVAVLKWHQVGCYTVAMSRVGNPNEQKSEIQGKTDSSKGVSSDTRVAHPNKDGTLSVKERRIQHARTAHWIAAGAKDGKVSLWDIY